MRRITAAIVTFCFTLSALGADWHALNAFDSAPRAMLYVQQPLGAKLGAASGLRFGLRLDREVSVSAADTFGDLGASPFAAPALIPRMALTDFYVTTRGHGNVLLSGMPMLNRDGEDDENTAFTGDSWTSFWFWVTATAVSVGILCLTETWICEEERRRETDTPSDGD